MIEPREDQLEAFMAMDQDQPIAMLNLLKFKDQAAYEKGSSEEPCSGAEAYMRYGAVAQKHVELVGGRMIFSAPAEHLMIGDGGLEWDVVAIVFYPSRKAFLEMVAKDDYRAALHHRAAGLEFQLLVQCDGSGLTA